MHDSVLNFAHEAAALRGVLGAQRVLDVGSLDVNGSTREVWPDCPDYVGIDGRPGPGVDIVSMSWSLPFISNYFDVVVSTEMLEHDAKPFLTFDEITRVLKPGGTFILTCRGPGFSYHEEPHDHWRFTPEQIHAWLTYFHYKDIYAEQDPGAPGVLAVATRNDRMLPTNGDPPELTPVR